jgi:hypothetical protein
MKSRFAALIPPHSRGNVQRVLDTLGVEDERGISVQRR